MYDVSHLVRLELVILQMVLHCWKGFLFCFHGKASDTPLFLAKKMLHIFCNRLKLASLWGKYWICSTYFHSLCLLFSLPAAFTDPNPSNFFQFSLKHKHTNKPNYYHMKEHTHVPGCPCCLGSSIFGSFFC